MQSEPDDHRIKNIRQPRAERREHPGFHPEQVKPSNNHKPYGTIRQRDRRTGDDPEQEKNH